MRRKQPCLYRVVQHLQGHLDFREVQGVPWDHHVQVDLELDKCYIKAKTNCTKLERKVFLSRSLLVHFRIT